MPLTINGCGTSVCPSRGSVRWGKRSCFVRTDHDAVECFVLFWLPVIPYRAVHTFDWNGVNYRQIPLKSSASIVIRAFLNRWLAAPISIGLLLLAIGLCARPNDADKWSELFVGSIMTGLPFVGWWMLWFLDKRTKNIRRLLGQHKYGSSDPANWHQSLFSSLRSAKDLFETQNFHSAVVPLLKEGKLASAMWAARLSTALEDKVAGEKLTSKVLADGQVIIALHKIKRNPPRWSEFIILPDPVLN